MRLRGFKNGACVLLLSAGLLSNNVLASGCDEGIYKTYQNLESLGWDQVHADLYTQIMIGSTCDTISLDATGSAGVTLFSKKLEVASAQVSALIDSDNNKQFSSRTLVLGFEVENSNVEHRDVLDFSETPAFPIDAGGQYGFDLGIVALSLHYGVMGEISSEISANLTGLDAKASLVPHIESDAYLSGKLGFLTVGSTVNIIRDTLTVSGQGQYVTEEDAAGLNIRGMIKNQGSSLGGNVYMKVFGRQTDLFNWDAFNDDRVLVDAEETLYF